MSIDDLSSIDNGVSVEQRLWNIHSLVPDEFELDVSTRSVYMLVLPKEQLGASARAFDLIDRTSSSTGMRSALLQFVLRTIEKIVADYNATNNKDNQNHPYPLHMYLETVVESELSANSHAAKLATANIRDVVANMFYGKEQIEKLQKSDMPARTLVDAKLLKGCEKRAVLQYRLWIVLDSSFKFPAVMEEVLALAIKEYAKRTTATTLAVDNEALREYKKLTGVDASTVDFSISNILKSDEHWAVINSRDALLDVVAIYTGDHSLLKPEFRSVALSATDSLKSVNNPAYLGAVFSAARQFLDVDPRVDEKQALYDVYFKIPYQSKYTLTFPYGNRVLIVPPEIHNRKFIVRYTPDYQLFNAQNRLLRKDLQEAQKRIANVAVAAVSNDAQSRNNNDDDDDESWLAGGDGNKQYNAAQDRVAAANAVLEDQSATNLERCNAKIVIDMNRNEKMTQTFNRTAYASTSDQQNSAINELVLPSSRYVDPQVQQQRIKVDQALAGHVTMTMLRRLKVMFMAERDKLLSMQRPVDRMMMYTQIQKTALRDYMMSCTSPQSDISTVGKTINAFMRHAAHVHEAFFVPVLFFDKKLSVFGHMMVDEFFRIDKVFHTHSTHMLVELMTASHMSAYQDAFKLKLHVLAISPPEEGKSRAVELEEKRSIPGTLHVITRFTAKALTDGESHNDETVASHGMSRELILDPAEQKNSRSSKSDIAQDTQQLETFKTVLTSGIARTGDMKRAADGTFRQGVRVSERQQTFIGLSNLDPEWIAEAIKSRFVVKELAKFQRRDATVGDKCLDEDNMSASMQRLQTRCTWEFRLMQALFYHVEKLIAVGVLTEPTLAAFSVYSPIFTEVLKTYGIHVRIRSLIKMELFIRYLVIRRALFALYQAPLAPFSKQNISIEHLPRIDPWLYDSSEIVFFAFDVFRDQYIDPHVSIVSRALRKLISQRCNKPAIFERHRCMDTKKQHTKSPMVSSLDSSTWKSVDPNDYMFDFNRVLLRTRMDALEKELAAIIAKTETLHLTAIQVGQTLRRMAKQIIEDHEYVPNPEFVGPATDEAFPVMRDTTTEKRPQYLVNVDRNNNIVTIHASVFQLMCDDPIEKVIEACSDRNMTTRKMLRGRPDDKNADLPHMLGTRTLQPRPDVVHIVPNRGDSFLASEIVGLADAKLNNQSELIADCCAESLINEKRQRGVLIYNTSVDDYALYKRLDKIHLPRESYRGFSFDSCMDNICAKSPETFVSEDKQIDYPNTQTVHLSSLKQLSDFKQLFVGQKFDDVAQRLEGRVAFFRHVCYTDKSRQNLFEFLKTLGYDISTNARLEIERAHTAKVQAIEEEARRQQITKEAEAEHQRVQQRIKLALQSSSSSSSTPEKRRRIDSAGTPSTPTYEDLYRSEN